MEILKSLYSNKVEEELGACSACGRGAPEDRQAAIKGLIGGAAGVEPDLLLRLKDEMEKLRKLFNETQPEVEQAARNVEEMIAKHLNVEDNKPSGDCKNIESDSGEKSNSSSLENFGMHEGDEILKTSKSKSDFINKVNSLRSIKSKIDSLVEQEIERAKTKKELIQKEIENQENKVSTKYVDCLAVYSDDDSGDEMTVEESRMFLEALKLDKERSAANTFTDKEHNETEFQDNLDLYTIEENESTNSVDFKAAGTISPRIYFTPRDSNIAPVRNDITSSINTESDVVNYPEIYDQSVVRSRNISRVASTWWSTDNSLASDILQKLKLAADCLGNQYVEETSKSTTDILEGTEPDITGFDPSIQQVASILTNISENIKKIFSEKENFTDVEYKKVQSLNIANILLSQYDNNVVDESYSSAFVKEEYQIISAIKEMAWTFSIIAEQLNKISPEVKQNPISKCNPPPSLMEALVILAHTEYFENCFSTVLTEENDESVENNNSNLFSEDKIESKSFNKALYHLNGNKVSESVGTEMHNYLNSRLRRCYPMDSQNPENLKFNLNDYEHYLGLSPATMTVENFSHMLLLLSSVLNEFPSQLKSAKFLELDPPNNLLQGLGILYAADDINGTVDLARAKSFASLTLQDVSDFTLTLSKSFYDAPRNIRQSYITDLSPPESLMNAVKILTSLLSDPVFHGFSQVEIQVQEWLPNSQSQEKFFDAVDSVTSLNHVS